MESNLKRLILITCTALLGIVGLQIFWIYDAYINRKYKLLDTANELILQTQITTGANLNLKSGIQNITENILNDSKIIAIPNPEDKQITKTIDSLKGINTDLESEESKNAQKLLDFLKIIKIDSIEKISLSEFKKALIKSFKINDITLPIEIGVVDDSLKTISATSNISYFEKLTSLNVPSNSLPVTFKGNLNGRILVKTTNLNWHILKELGSNLYFSIILTIICLLSFSFMIALFYKQKRLSIMKSDFMNNMTHELKTPISAISIALELLQDEVNPVSTVKKKEYFQVANGELKRLNQMLSKVLRMAAIEKMHMQPVLKEIEAFSWIDNTVNTLSTLLSHKDVIIKVDIYPEDLTLVADLKKLNSILINLIENAVKYRDFSKPNLLIEINAWKDKKGFWLSVSDNGIGISDKYKDKVFEKFYRVTSGENHDTKGYGLGLSYAREVARLHGGTLQLTSKINEGSTFTLYLPQNE